METIASELTLTGRLVRLEPLSRDHAEGLREAVRDGEMWTRWYTSVPRPEGIEEMIDERLGMRDAGTMVPFTAIRQRDDQILGCTSFYQLAMQVPRVTIGYTWNRASAHGSGTNPESKLLLMGYAFETLGVEAVRFETSWNNHQSRAAIERLGCRLDGVLRADARAANGALRDTAVYSLLKHEWPSAKANLELRVERHVKG